MTELGRRFVLIAMLLIVPIGGLVVLQHVRHPAGPTMLDNYALDFRVVYCAAEAARHGQDPYLVEPLRSCEHRVGRESNEPDWSVTPLPLPGYAIGLFVPFSLLPFAIAKALYLLVMLLALALAAAALGAMLRGPTLAVYLVMAPMAGYLNLFYGEPVPLAIGALCVAGYLLELGKPRAAGVVAALAAVQPHLALPAFLALLIFVPRARIALLGALAVLAVLGLATLGFERNIEYFATLLPLHARAELLANDQFGLSRVLYLLGVRPGVAMALGSASYAAAAVAGLILARRYANALERPALLVLFPAAAVTFGGAFIHDVQIAAALPAMLLLAQLSWPARIGIGLLAVLWWDTVGGEVIRVMMASLGAIFVIFPREGWRTRIAWLAGAPLLGLLLLWALPAQPAYSYATIGTPSPAVRDSDPASIAWAWRVKLSPGRTQPSLRAELEKVPVWLALGLLFFVRPRKPEPADESLDG
jgi:hypothetical protein